MYWQAKANTSLSVTRLSNVPETYDMIRSEESLRGLLAEVKLHDARDLPERRPTAFMGLDTVQLQGTCPSWVQSCCPS